MNVYIQRFVFILEDDDLNTFSIVKRLGLEIWLSRENYDSMILS